MNINEHSKCMVQRRSMLSSRVNRLNRQNRPPARCKLLLSVLYRRGSRILIPRASPWQRPEERQIGSTKLKWHNYIHILHFCPYKCPWNLLLWICELESEWEFEKCARCYLLKIIEKMFYYNDNYFQIIFNTKIITEIIRE